MMNKVMVLFNINNNNSDMGPWSTSQADQGENDPSSLWLSDPSSMIEIKDSLNTALAASAAAAATVTPANQEITKPIQFENQSPSSLTENLSTISVQTQHQNHHHQQQTQSFFTRELNF
uniref:Uncharacterized protein n=1 Tax=Nelumbo nucifera TaxID=4432 RepID=A0A822ZQE1_NELNU|nr:TPA_asm: hypothetical protein HUJ06_018131 [Nelumbo nucifera]